MVGRYGFEPQNPKEQISLLLQFSLPPLCVCSLDFLLAIFVKTQAHRIKSLHSVLKPSSGLTYKVNLLSFPRISDVHLSSFQLRVQLEDILISPDQDHSLPRLTTSLSPQKNGADRESRTPNLLIHTTIVFTTTYVFVVWTFS